MDLLERPEWRLAVAAAVGLIVGVERERRKGDGPSRTPAGVRTFTLVALLGGLAAQSGSEALVVLAGAFVAGAALVGYALGDRGDPGLTSEVAFVLTYVLGVLAQGQPALALAVGVIVTVVLAVRSTLHHAIRNVLTGRELIDALTFAVVALVVLPLAPDRAVDPFGVLNPFTLWRLVVVVMTITGAGYVAQRLIGARFGLPLTGFASGFVSSTATIAAMGARVKGDARLLAPAVAGAAASTVATFVQLAIVVGTVNPLLLVRLAWPLGLGGFAALVYAVFWLMRTARIETVPANVAGRAFDVRGILLFSLVVALVTVLSVLLERWLGTVGALVAAGTAGLADAHAAAASIVSINAAGELDPGTAALGVLIAVSSNTLSKAAFASSAGTRAFAMRVQIGLLLAVSSTWLGFALLK